MRWRDFLGHTKQIEWFQQAVAQQRLASTFLMVGPDGCGKRTFSRLMAKALLCFNRDPQSMDACDRCESCTQVDADTHPDLLQVSKPPEASSLSIEILVGSRENRLRDGVCYELHMKPFQGPRRIAIIDDADTIQEAAANSMLKTLEEPPPGAVIFLIGSNEQRQLSTIRSRSQIVRFQRLTDGDVATLLIRHGLVSEQATAEAIAKIAKGSIAEAIAYLDEDFQAFRIELLKKLAEQPFDFVGVSKSILANSQTVGEEGSLRRRRLKTIFAIAIEHYRAMLYHGVSVNTFASFGPPTEHLLSRSAASLAMEKCIVAQSDVDRMVTPAALLESWSTELAEICQGG